MTLILALILGIFLINPVVASASDVTVSCSGERECHLTGTTPLFSSAGGPWSPGRLSSRSFTITNSDSKTRQLGLKADRNGQPSILDNALSISITGTDYLWAGHLSDLYQAGEIDLGSLSAGHSREYLFTVSFDTSAGNSYQNQTSTFDLTLGFASSQPPTPTPTVIPTPVINPASGLYLNEIFPGQNSKVSEWVEIFNSNPYPVTLQGWKIDDDTINQQCDPRPLPSNDTIPALSYYIFSPDSNCFNQANDKVVLLNHNNNIVDSYSYDTLKDFSRSWSRQSPTNWCETVPTKGSLNAACFNSVQPTEIQPPPSPAGQVMGASTVSCTDSPPQSAPQLLSAIPGTNSVTLRWSEGSGPLTYYLIAFGSQPGQYQFGNPNIGGPGTTSYTINNLNAGQTYYFVVRSGNGCSPGAFSYELSAIPLGVQLSPQTLPEGFQTGVLGDTTDPNKPALKADNTSNGQVAGSSTCQSTWLPVLWLLALGLTFLLNPAHRPFYSLASVFIFGIAFIVDTKMLAQGCCLVAQPVCRLYPLAYTITFIASQISPLLSFRRPKA